ncbi:cobalamin B12-binding domain-containing protein [Pelorhabdus rhamnosifermentans]|uniref:cobalamin B12-binding domain-containing protein n=1 Tax=Pelorhabdus rhamnosifermentans TaxID=2772457 RepID=UPI001C060B2C|nr:cobalamin-dependent protein [Pelorhabdus rhamnosifermentans]
MAKTDLAKAMAELDEELVVAGVTEQLAGDVPAIDVLAQLQQGMEQVGKLYEAGDYYLSELIMSADVFSTAAELLGSALTADGASKKLGTMVLGTVKDDIHDIGKNIVATILNCNGFQVVDLGVDVPISDFVAAIKTHKPQVVGMCCLLTTAFDVMKATVAAVKMADSSVTILVGGGPVDASVCKYVGADKYCRNAYDAVAAIRKAVGVN